ncbi:MAG TPA: hypothetical protein VE867_05465, partial [Candidatus Binatia bacterium]|nr:hypothetical protein [Candidatus Binatia bacterium]
AEVRQRNTTADKVCFLDRASFVDVDVEELSPATGISIRFCVHDWGSAVRLSVVRFFSTLNEPLKRR